MGALFDRSHGFSLITDLFLKKGERYDIKYNPQSKKCEITDEDGNKHIYTADCFQFDDYIESRSKRWRDIKRGEDGIRRDGYGNELKDGITCPWCGIKFDQTNKNQKYCSEACAVKYQNKFQAEKIRKKNEESRTKTNIGLEEYVKMCAEKGMTYAQIVSNEILNAMGELEDDKQK